MGDKWIKGSEFILGDAETSLLEFVPRQADLIFTSPPYFNQREEYATYKSFEEYMAQMTQVFLACEKLLKYGGMCVVNIGQDRSLDLPAHFSIMLQRLGLKYVDTICWNKMGEIGTRGMFLEQRKYYPNFSWEPIYVYRKGAQSLSDDLKDFPMFEERFIDTITNTFRTNVWNIIPERNSWHPAAFPLKLAMTAIMCYTQAGGIVIDPFGGSGTTARACNEVGNRIYILTERNREYYDRAIKEQGEPGLGI